ncbi:MAG: hypothetical protein U0269_22345 [Polyangiales bacterium]
MESRERPLFDRFFDALPLRSRGAFHWISARDSRDRDQRRTLVVAGPTADRDGAARAIERCRIAHQQIDHPCVPKPVAHDLHAPRPWLAFDCPATCDGIDFVRALGESESRISYRAADGFIASLRTALQSAHATLDERGAPRCLGRISLGNLLFDSDGRWYLVGFGANLAVEKDNGSIDGSVVFFQPSELYGGGDATPMGDYVALLQFRRSVVPYVEIPPRLARILRGEFEPEDSSLLQDLQWTEQRLLGAMPHNRPTYEEAIAVAERIRVALGSDRDEEGMRAFVANLFVESDLAPVDDRARERSGERQSLAPRTLHVGPDCAWILVDGARRRLGNALRRILHALVEQHSKHPGVPLNVWSLLSAGWPGEDPLPEVGANRVYVTLNRLRSQGLRDFVERFDDGYRLAPDCVVQA